MRIKRFVLRDDSIGFYKEFNKGMVFDTKNRILHNYCDDETDLLIDTLLCGYKIARKSENIPKTTEEDFISATTRFDFIDYFDNPQDLKKGLFLSLDNSDVEGVTVIYYNLNNRETLEILEKIKFIKNRLYLEDAKNRIKSLFLGSKI